MSGTRKALVLWESIRPEPHIILNQVWYSQCRKGVGITNRYASVLKGDLLLEVTCVVCGFNVAKYLEMQA